MSQNFLSAAVVIGSLRVYISGWAGFPMTWSETSKNDFLVLSPIHEISTKIS